MRVFQTTEGLDVFLNEAGSIMMEQEDIMGDDPSRIVIPLERVEDVVKALRAVKREAKD